MVVSVGALLGRRACCARGCATGAGTGCTFLGEATGVVLLLRQASTTLRAAAATIGAPLC